LKNSLKEHKHVAKGCLCEALSFAQLFNLSEPKRIVRSNTVKGPPLDVKAFDDAQYHIFNFKSNPSTTGLRHHGYIKFNKPKKTEALTEIPCLVDCTCQDYRYRWAWTNKQRGASKVGAGSMNQALNRAPRITNPTNRPGLCKHILALKNYLQGLMWDLPKTGIKTPDGVLSNLVTYANNRWTNLPQQMAAARARDARFAAAKASSRAGQPQPNADELPGIPATEEPQASELPQPPESEQPEMPENIEQAQKIKPPAINLKPEKGRPNESMNRVMVDSLCNMRSLTEELSIIGQLIEDAEAQTPPTEGEAAHSNALDLLKSIDSGIKSLNTGIQALSAEMKPEADVAKEEEGTEAEEEATAGAEEAGAVANQADDVANLEQELQKLGVPQQ
jgi:hypothetical protein